MSFEPKAFLEELRRRRDYAGQLVYVQTIPARPPRYGQLHHRLSAPIAAALRSTGAEQLYTHQAEAINAALDGQHVVVATSTASGKTLCFNVPVLEALARDPLARALYIYPTKALTQDQLGKWQAFAAGAEGGIIRPEAATYDGDTPQGARARIRKNARVLLTNPDMLHAGILPNHPLWAEFFRHLKYVVIDEAHSYRGVFGSQVACVLRRLRRVCALYGPAGGLTGESITAPREARTAKGKSLPGGGPQFIATSATIANPAEHFELLTGLRATVISDDGSPHGPRTFAFWNPPFLDSSWTARRSANREATDLFTALVGAGVRTIAFTRARVVAELLLRYAREQLKRTAPEMANRVAAYRAGYLATERRRIERELFGGKLVGVTATTALELGIDVGGLDAALLVGYPGTVASTWQQAGRAGRGQDPSLAMLVGLDNPLDQFYMRHGAELLGKPHENALLDPDNVYILQRHLPCAAHEVPLSVPAAAEGFTDSQERAEAPAGDDEALFGPGFVDAMIVLEESDTLRYNGERWVYTQRDYPAQDVNLRDAEGERFAILNAADDFRTLEELSSSTAPFRVHPGAIYLHHGESYLVTEYSHELRYAIAKPVEADYYTQPRELNDVRIIRSMRHRQTPEPTSLPARDLRARNSAAVTAYLGRVRVRSQVVGYRRLQQFTEAVLGEAPLEMPLVEFETVALWWDLPSDLPAQLAAQGLDFMGGIHAVEHAAIGILPLFAMCDRWDIGGLSTPRHPDTDAPQIFIYDGFPGGVGIAEKGFDLLRELWVATLDVLQGCPCVGGCPGCVQSPKCGNFNQPLDKLAAMFILRQLLRV